MPIKSIYSAIGIGLFMLLIAAINFINLSSAQAAGRAREVGVRKVLGSSRRGLIKQYLHENILIVLVATIFSLVITQALLGEINIMLSLISMRLKLDLLSIILAVGVGVTVIMLSCVIPLPHRIVQPVER